MTDRFDICVAFVLERETEFNPDGLVRVERDPNDPGGVTKFGIDQRDHPGVDVANLSAGAAKEIYRSEEWSKARCSLFKMPWDLAIFDTAVNPGLGFVATALQKAVNGEQRILKVDGLIGPKTIAATNAAARDALDRFFKLREAYYNARPDYIRGKPFKIAYLKGWLARVQLLREACKA